MIEIHRLSKSFGDQRVLHDISAKFHPGKVNFIIGRSGSGKSVMTKCTVFSVWYSFKPSMLNGCFFFLCMV